MLEENNFNAENTGSEQTGAQSMADIHPQTETEEQADTATYAAAEPQADEQAKIGQEAYEPPAAPVVYIPYGFTPQTFAEKKQIRKTALVIGIPCICLSFISFIWSFIYLFATTKIAGLSYSAAIELASNPAVQQVLQIIASCLMFLLPFPIAARCAGCRIDKTVDLCAPKKHTFLPFYLLGIGFCAFANISMSYSSAFFEGFGIDYSVDYGDNPNGFFGFLLTFIATAIVPALVEEFACRGIVIGLLRKYGEAFAIVTSSIIFGVMHGNFDQMPFAVIVGLILGYIYVKTGSLWASVAVHCTNNAVSVIFTYLDGSALTSNLQNVLYSLYLLFSLLAAICGIYLILKRYSDIFALEKACTESSEKQKYKWFFTSWIIIVFLVLNILDSFKYFII